MIVARFVLLAAFLFSVGAVPALAQQGAGSRSMVPVMVDGESVRMAVITHRPAGDGPFPTLIFHHGSTGRGTDPSTFARPYDPTALANWFVQRGWAVVLPSRRGRGGSEGRYDEGFDSDRTRGYSCQPTLSLPGADRALRDIDAATDAILQMPFVDRARLLVGGLSRGGVLAIAWSGRRPTVARGAINFVGGWMSESCAEGRTINQDLFRRGGAYRQPTLWLYGENDPFYSLAFSRANFAVFQQAGGRGSFHDFMPPQGVSGHQISAYPTLWSTTADTYIGGLGLR